MNPLAVIAPVLPDDLFALPAALATALCLALFTAALPLRGGHGQHAGAGPGALTVRQLCAAESSAGDGSERQDGSVAATYQGPQETERDRIPEAPEAPVPPQRAPWCSGQRGPSPLESALAEALKPSSNTGYVGRHRLHEPETFPPPFTEIRVPLPSTPPLLAGQATRRAGPASLAAWL